MALPSEMRHVAVREPGGPEMLEIATGPLPTPRTDEVLIRVAACGVNRPDVFQRKGLYPPPPDASPLLGLEAAGEVVARGETVTDIEIGARVTSLCNGGAYAEYVVAPAAQCLPWPEGLDAVEAASLPETCFTVWANLFGLGRLRPGERVLVHGGTSGIGVMAIQLASAFGATVYATAGSAAKCTACLDLGAAGAINYNEADFLEDLRGMADGEGVDVVLDMVGAPYAARNLKALRRDGRLVLIAFLGGSKPEAFDLLPVMLKRLTVTGSTMRPQTTAEKGAIAAALRETAWPWFAQKRVRPVVHSVLPAERAGDAHRLMESSTHIGKIMLTFS